MSHIVCPHCNAVNRIPVDKPAAQGKCGRCHKPLFDGHPTVASLAGFNAQVQKSDVPVVVDFWAEWCGPCKAMAPHFERVAGELEPQFRFLKVDTEAEPELAARYQIRSIPTLMVFKNGAIIAQQAGAMDSGSLRNWLKQVAG
jgi:thioredoxin 2